MTQGATGRNNVGDGICHTQLDGNLYCSIKTQHVSGDSASSEVVTHQVRVRGCNTLAIKLFDGPLFACWSGIAEGGGSKTKRQNFMHVGARILS